MNPSVAFLPTIVVSLPLLLGGAALAEAGEGVGAVEEAVRSDYDQRLAELFEYFHRNPELSFQETNHV